MILGCTYDIKLVVQWVKNDEMGAKNWKELKACLVAHHALQIQAYDRFKSILRGLI